ncbi:hypothetical protein GFC03_01435 [Klebsiella quasivariicola]|nr:hypothetical protein [Klebsiella quasivariicola]
MRIRKKISPDIALPVAWPGAPLPAGMTPSRILFPFMPGSRGILRRLSEKISFSAHFFRIKEKLKWFRFILSLI